MATQRGRRRSALVLFCVLVVAPVGCAPPPPPGPVPAADVPGRVVDLDGRPVADAEVRTDSGTTRTDAQGGFSVPATVGGSWVTVAHAGFLGRTRAGTPGDPLLVRLTPDDGQTVALQFGGDVMMGRRFFDPDEDGSRSDALIKDPSDVGEHTALLDSIAPLLRDGDLTEVNVESPVVAEPFIDPAQPRPSTAHPTKRFVFASGPALPEALGRAGVDVVGLANNHQYDMLEEGVGSTVDRFTAAGFAPGARQFGLGHSVDAAYAPAVNTVKGTRIAFLGCTSITGSEQPISYVAGPEKGGAAPCDPIRIRDSVAAAKASGAVVVFSVHGGFEYGRSPSGQVQSFTQTARDAGATLVVNAHPHVVGGLDWNGSSLAAWSLGNLVFDQTVWPTFESYVLNVHLRQGRIVRAFLEPVMIDGYVAHGLRPGFADHVDRTALGRSKGPFTVEDGAVELDLGGRPPPVPASVPLPPSPAGTIAEIGTGWSVRDTGPPGVVQTGQDLLWTGDFEADTLGEGPGALWTSSPDASIIGDPDPSRGQVYRLTRTSGDAKPVTGTTTHRALLNAASAERLRRLNKDDDDEGAAPPADGPPVARPELTLNGMARLDPGARAEVQLSWFSDTKGPSASQTVRVLDGGATGRPWEPLRVDATAPPDAVAVQVFVRLYPPRATPGRPNPPSTTSADVDGLRLIEWSGPGPHATTRATHLRTYVGGEARLERAATTAGGPVPEPLTVLPGGGEGPPR
ncbi:CapA family protein [Pseudonocardia phyllosphaerae]|uniref:CapA family protein n=1 Tax=Pseudonocardia phyllosphaerae TaxID=3390502 RepID=UPI00397B8F24